MELNETGFATDVPVYEVTLQWFINGVGFTYEADSDTVLHGTWMPEEDPNHPEVSLSYFDVDFVLGARAFWEQDNGQDTEYKGVLADFMLWNTILTAVDIYYLWKCGQRPDSVTAKDYLMLSWPHYDPYDTNDQRNTRRIASHELHRGTGGVLENNGEVAVKLPSNGTWVLCVEPISSNPALGIVEVPHVTMVVS
jgi:hypothetical protein